MKRHNSAYNYFNAVGSKDKGYAKDLVMNDVSDIIITKTPMVVAGIRHANIPIDKNADHRKIASILVENMGSNQQLAKNMARLVTFQHMNAKPKQNFAGEKLNTDGPFLPTPDGTGAGLPAQDVLKNMAQPSSGNSVGAVANAISSIFGVFGNKQQITAQREQNKADLIAMIGAKTGKKTNPTKTFLIVGGVLAGLTIAGLLIYKFTKKAG